MSDTVTLRLNGEVSLEDFAKAITGFQDLVHALSTGTGGGVTWRIADLDYGSASATAQGIATEPQRVQRVVQAYAAVGRAASTNALNGYTRSVATATGTILSVLSGRADGVESVDFETADGETTIRAVPQLEPVKIPHATPRFGAVTGRVQTLSSRGSLRFTLYDQLHDKAVSCYLAEGREDIMRDVWDKIAVVEGVVTRDDLTGRPKSVRQVSQVTVKPEGLPMDFLTARGASPSAHGMTATEAIRRVRDA